MTAKFFKFSAAALGLTVALSLGAGSSSAQYGQAASPAPAPTQNAPAPKESGKPQKINKAEEAAYKNVLAAQGGDPAMQIQVGEDFITKFPMSKYVPGVYGMLTPLITPLEIRIRCSPREPSRSNSILTTWMYSPFWRWPFRVA